MRHPEAGARMPHWQEESSKAERPQPTRNGGRQGERLSESSTNCAGAGGVSCLDGKGMPCPASEGTCQSLIREGVILKWKRLEGGLIMPVVVEPEPTGLS